MDLAPATRLFRRGGKLDRILIEAPSTRSMEEWEALLRQRLPEGVAIARQGTQTDENRRMLEAFRWNLRVLSYVSLAVGAFLIYNTISVSVVRRRFEIGILRAMGTPRMRDPGGISGRGRLLRPAGRHMRDCSRTRHVGRRGQAGRVHRCIAVLQQPAGADLAHVGNSLLGIAMGIGIALVSALGPAWEASRVAPVEAMARGSASIRFVCTAGGPPPPR